MKKLTIILTALLLSGCTAAAMNGFQRGLMGYAPPPVQQPVFHPVVIPQAQMRSTYGTITAPNGQMYQYNSMSY